MTVPTGNDQASVASKLIRSPSGRPIQRRLTVPSDQNGWFNSYSISPLAGVDSRGYGNYRVSISRAGLEGAVHSGNVLLRLSDGGLVEVPVNVQVVSPPAGPGDPGKISVLLRDQQTLAVVYRTAATRDGAGRFRYRFEQEVEAGNYRIYAGSDIDNDGDLDINVMNGYITGPDTHDL